MKRVLALILCLVMALSLIPAAAAEDIEIVGEEELDALPGDEIEIVDTEAEEPEILSSNYSAVMTADEFIGYLKTALNRKSKYNNNYPYNVGYYDGEYISWDCWDLGVTIITSRGEVVNNYTVDKYYKSTDATIGLTGEGGDYLKSACGNTLSKDFTNIVPGEWLFYDNDTGGTTISHVGYYIGNGKVIEIHWPLGTPVKEYDLYSDGTASGSSPWHYHGKVPWISYVPSFEYRNEYFCDLTVTTSKSTSVWSMPGNTSTYPASEQKDTLASGTKVHATKIYENNASEAGHYWYQISYGSNKTGYIYVPNTKNPTQNWTVSASSVSKPGTLALGETFDVRGTVSTGGSKMTKLQGFIYPGSTTSGTPNQSSEAVTPNSTSYDLRGIDLSLYFDRVKPEGTYTYTVKVNLESYTIKDGKPSKETDIAVNVSDVTTCYQVGSTAPTMYYLDINGYLDGQNSGNISGYGTCDVYINGSLVAAGVTDYYAQWPTGTKYEIKNIKATSGHKYNGPYSGSLTGTIELYDVKVVLNFSTYNEYSVKYVCPSASFEKTVPAGTYTVEASYSKESNSYFSGWAYSSGAAQFDIRPGETINVDRNITLYAVYISHSEAISGEPALIYNINDFPSSGYTITKTTKSIPVVTETAYWTDWSAWSETAVSASDTVEVETRTAYGWYYFECPNCHAHMHGYGTCWTWCGGCGATTTAAGWHQMYDPTNWNVAKDWYGTGKYYTTINGATWFKWDDGGTKTQYRSREYIHTTTTEYKTYDAYIITENATKPTITTQPTNKTIVAGETAKFTVKASGTGLSYQWYYRENSDSSWKKTSLTGNTTATLSVYGKTTRNGFQYRCKVTNAAGYVRSNIVTLTVIGKPTITTQPTNKTIVAGETAKFTVKVSGTGLSYQWYYRENSDSSWKKTSLTGNTTATLSVYGKTTRNGFQYRCKITNTAGYVRSNIVTLTVIGKPTITTQPTNKTIVAGETAKFTVKASGTGLSYQWYYRENSDSSWKKTSLTGNTTATLSVYGKTTRNGFQYRCKITNAAGYVRSNIVTLKVTAVTKPTITTQPFSKTAYEGDTVRFTVKASGTGLSYQWYYRENSSSSWKKTSLTGATTDALSVLAKTTRNGFQYRCKITNAAGYVYTNIVTLTVK